MLPTEGTGKRKPEEEDGGGRQKKEQEGDRFLHRRLGGRQKREMKEGWGSPDEQKPQPAMLTQAHILRVPVSVDSHPSP